MCTPKIKDYLALGSYPQLPLPNECPRCNSQNTMIRNGYYNRKACTETEEFDLKIGRGRCKNRSCNASVALLPDFLIPRRHYVAEVIEKSLREKILSAKRKNAVGEQVDEAQNNSRPSRQTVRHWILGLTNKINDIGEYLARLIPRLPEREDDETDLEYLLRLLFASSKRDPGEILAWHNYQFQQQFKSSIL